MHPNNGVNYPHQPALDVNSNLNPNASAFTIDEYKDLSLPWNQTRIQSYDEFSKLWMLGDKINNGGQASIYKTKCILAASTNQWAFITKIYKYKNNFEKNKIFQEYMMITKTKLIFYDNIFYGLNNNEIYIVMDYLNYTLCSVVKYKHDIELHDFQCIKSNLNLKYFLLEIAAFLQLLHSNNYVHLDIKPSNIMFRNGNCDLSCMYGNGWKLIDFGVCRYINPINNYIKLNHYCGTRGWSAPEMSPVNKTNIITTKTDIWSFGLIILYIINDGINIFDSKKKDLKDFWYNKLYGNNPNILTKKIKQHLLNLKINNKICSDLYNLLSRMLIYEQDKRISAYNILGHKWLVDYIGNCDGKLYLKRNKTRMISDDRINKDWLRIA